MTLPRLRYLPSHLALVIACGCFHIRAGAQTIASGYGHSFAICTDSTVMSWGWNLSGQLGNGYPTLTGDCQCFTYAAPVAWLDSVVAVVGGEHHSMALRSDGTVRVWGLGASGQLGYGFIPGSTCTCAALPVQPINLPPITAIAAGFAHSLALASDSTVWAWGNNADGELGDGSGFEQSAPVQVAGLTGVVGIAAGYYHSLAIRSDGTVWAWGQNDLGQLGDTTHADRLTPVQVHGLADVIAVDGGLGHSVALKNDGTVWVWGSNYFHQLLDSALADTAAPIRINGLNDVRAITAGRYHTAVLRSDSTVWSWAHNQYGQMGNGTSGLDVDTLVQTTGLTGVVQIAAEGDHTMALKSDGTVWSWGYNYYGQLGDDSRLDHSTPVQMWNLCEAPIALENPDIDAADPLRVSPNPFDDRIVIASADLGSDTRFQLFTLTGELVLSGQVRDRSIDTGSVRAGCYVLQVRDAQGKTMGRTLVVKL